MLVSSVLVISSNCFSFVLLLLWGKVSFNCSQ